MVKDNQDKTNNKNQNKQLNQPLNNKNQLKRKDNLEEEGQEKVNNDQIYISYINIIIGSFFIILL